MTGAEGKGGGLGGWLSQASGVSRSRDSSKVDQWPKGEDGSAYQSLWSPDVASAMGYGKNGRSGSAFQWWIPLLSTIVAIGGFIAWAVFAFRARDATQAALDAAHIHLSWWGVLASILLATAVCFPLFTVLALGVSLWRAHMARQLNIHAPTKRWARRSKAWQVVNVVSSILLYCMAALLVASLAAHAVWAFTAVAAHYGSYYAIKYVDPVWSGVSNVVNASEALVDNFLGLATQLPVIGGRRLVEFDPVNARHIVTRHLTQADVEAMPAATREAGLAAGRALQQLPDIVNGLGGILNNAASALNTANVVPNQVGAGLSQLGQLPFLPQLLPNGTSNPLFSTLSSVTEAVQAQLLNRSGCPAWCVDMRDQSWLGDGCMCNLDRVKAAYPYLGSIYHNAVPAMGLMFAMLAAATWLLLHAASQWARTRSEAKLLQRLPNAAQLAAAQHSQQQQQGMVGNGGGGVGGAGAGSKGLPVTQMDAAKGGYSAPLPAV